MPTMKPRYRISRAAIDLIKRFEGYRHTSAALPAGGWTIGYGHTLTAREGAQVSESDAEALLLYDLIAVAHSVNEHVFAPLTQNQFDALTAFAFNIGIENFQHSSVLRRLNEGHLLQAACAMELWRKAEFEGERIVVDALVRRRSVEKTLFLTPPGGFQPAPTPILPPNLDLDFTGVVPRQVPTALAVALDGDLAVAEREEPPPPIVPEEDKTFSPSQAAAESVSARLATIFPDTDQPAAILPPAIVLDELVLTAEEPDFNTECMNRQPEPPVEAANESEPGLFDLPLTVANDYTETVFEPQPLTATDPEPETPAEPEPAPAVGVTSAYEPEPNDLNILDHDLIVLPVQPVRAPAKSSYLPPALLAVVGMGIFSGGVLGGVNNYNALAWVGGVLGIGLFAVAVYLLLDRLGQVDAEPDADADGVTADRDE